MPVFCQAEAKKNFMGKRKENHFVSLERVRATRKTSRLNSPLSSSSENPQRGSEKGNLHRETEE
jgi:hypothetical protein